MKKIMFLYIYLILFCGNSYGLQGLNDFCIQLNYGQNEVNIPLKLLKQKTVRPPLDNESEFTKVDGIYFSNNGDYIEGLCRFNDISGGKWELKFSSEKLLNKNFSTLSVVIIFEDKVKQQNDFSFKGNPIDVLKCEVAPFRIIGLKTSKEEWFSISFKAQ